MPDFAEYSRSKVLVTGGMGFIGSHVAKRLVDIGSQVTIVDALIPGHGGNEFNIRDIAGDVEVHRFDLRDSGAIRQVVRGQDFVFNLAGQVSHIDSMTDPIGDLELNCRSQLSLLEACREANPGARIVTTGSRQQYGRPRFLPVTEEHPAAPVDINGVDKAAGERYHLLYHEVHGLRAVSLRLTNTYGPHLLMNHGRQGFMCTFIRLAIEGKPIKVFGDGSQLRDLTHVSDVVDALLAVALKDDAYGQAFNVGGWGPVPLVEVAELCGQIADAGSTVETVPWPPERKKIDIGSVFVDYSKLATLTGWQPETPLPEGLQETIDFYRAYGDHYWT